MGIIDIFQNSKSNDIYYIIYLSKKKKTVFIYTYYFIRK